MPLPLWHTNDPYYVNETQQHWYDLPKNLKPWQDPNPDLLLPGLDAVSTAPQRQGMKSVLFRRQTNCTKSTFKGSFH
jgi:hypothetical protein